MKKHCSIVAGDLEGKKRPFLIHKQAYKTAEKECILVSEGQHILYEGSFLLFKVMTYYNCASFPKAEIRALFALIIFEIPGLTGDFRLCVAPWAPFKAPCGEESIESE